MKLAILSTHPIQYNAPVFRLLAQREGIQPKVFYGWRGPTEHVEDRGFGTCFKWDIPLLDGYEYEFAPDSSSQAGAATFHGINSPDVHRRIARWNPDAILVYGWSYRAHLKVMRYFHRKTPLLFRGDSTLLDEKRGCRKVARRLFLSWVYRHVKIALYAGTNNRRYFEAHGLTNDRLVFAPHAIDNERFGKAEWEAESERWRADLGIREDDVAVLFVGKMETKKSPDLLIDAFAELTRNPDSRLHLIFAGTGPLETSLRSRELEDVHFIGFQNQSRIPAVYRLGDIVFLPSIGPGESWGLVLNEAMACGRAVAASEKVGAAVDLIEPGENGWIFPAGQVSELRNCLDRVRQLRRTRLLEMGCRSKEVIPAWSFQSQIHGIEEGLRRVS